MQSKSRLCGRSETDSLGARARRFEARRTAVACPEIRHEYDEARHRGYEAERGARAGLDEHAIIVRGRP